MEAPRQRQPHRSKSSQTVASFLLKTYEILENPEYSHIISWGADNISFSIKNFQLFAKEVLPRYFRHGNFSSFVRQVSHLIAQLNMYDFHKMKQDKNSIVFRNELFTRSGSKDLKHIKRKAPRNPRPEPGDSASNQRSLIQAKNNQIEPCSQSVEIYKRQIEQEANNSCWLFEKSIKQLERIVLAKQQAALFRQTLQEEKTALREAFEECDQPTTSTLTLSYSSKELSSHSTLDILYDLKKSCRSVFEHYEQLIQGIDKGLEAKLTVLRAQHSKKPKEPSRTCLKMEREVSACQSSKSESTGSRLGQEPERAAKSAGAFKPFSSTSLNQIVMREEGKTLSTPLFKDQVS